MQQVTFFNKLMPPNIEDVRIYFSQKGMPELEAEQFFLFYEKKQWKSKQGNYFKSWKQVAYRWIISVVSNQPLLFEKLTH